MRILFTLIFLSAFFRSEAQGSIWEQKFEAPDTPFLDQFVIDTQNHPNNVWQIGRPDKAVFDSAFSFPNAIVTDTLNPYPVNDTSVFFIKEYIDVSYPLPCGLCLKNLRFKYKLDIDSGEVAKVEVSGNGGITWIDVIAEDTTYDFGWFTGKPRLDTSIHDWTAFELSMSEWRRNYTPYPSSITADTFLYRFTFISDSIQTNKDGWILDNFSIENYVEGYVENFRNNHLITLYPNPSNGHIYIQKNQNRYVKPTVSIYNTQGQEVFQTDTIPVNGYLELPLPGGVYFLKYVAGDEYAVKRLVIAR